MPLIRPHYLYYVFLVLLVGAAAARPFGDWCQFSPDGFEYLTLARSVALAGSLPAREITYPPGFPVVLAPFVRWESLPFWQIRAAMIVCWMGVTLLTYRYHRQWLGGAWAWAGAALVGTSAVMLVQTTFILSEPIFMVLVMAALGAAGEVRLAAARTPDSMGRRVVVVGLLTGGAMLVRTLGVALLPAVAAAIWWTPGVGRRRRFLWIVLFGLTAGIPVAAWQVRQARYADEGRGYAHSWLGARSAEGTDSTGWRLQVERLYRLLPLRLSQVKAVIVPQRVGYRLFSPPHEAWSSWLVGGWLLSAAGWLFWRRRGPGEVYVLATVAVLTLWPWVESERLVLPLLPLLCGYLCWGLSRIWKLTMRGIGGPLAAGGLLVLMAAGQGMELAAVTAALPARREKFEAQGRDIRRLSVQLAAAGTAKGTVVGLVPDGSEAKVILMGAAYAAGLESLIYDLHFQGGTACVAAPPGIDRVWLPEGMAVERRPAAGARGPVSFVARLGNGCVNSPDGTSHSFRSMAVEGDGEVGTGRK